MDCGFGFQSAADSAGKTGEQLIFLREVWFFRVTCGGMLMPKLLDSARFKLGDFQCATSLFFFR
jgi:hypothetical protein